MSRWMGSVAMVVCLAMACGAGEDQAKARAQAAAGPAELFTPAATQNIRSPDKVEIVLREQNHGGPRKERGKWKRVDPESAAQLSRLLLDRNSYIFDLKPACGFDPGVSIRFTRGADSTVFDLCFECTLIYGGGLFEVFDPINGDLTWIVNKTIPGAFKK